MKELFIKLITSGSGLSSKRFLGFLGWIVCLVVAIYCTILEKQAKKWAQKYDTSFLIVEATT